MSVAFKRGTTTGPSDLSITIRDYAGNLQDPYRIEYSIYDRTTGVEVLIGSPVNIPQKLSIGQYYAEVVIPADVNIGDWVCRWVIQESAVDPVYQTVQEFSVIGDNSVISFTGDENLDKLVYSLRILLRDNNPDRNYSVSGNERVRFKIKDKESVISFNDFWNEFEIENGLYYNALMANELFVLSVSKDNLIEWKKVTDILRHDTEFKDQYWILVNDTIKVITTGDHSLYARGKKKIHPIKVRNLVVGNKIVLVKNNKIIEGVITGIENHNPEKYMFDLSVVDNHNFVLESGILAHNSFRPPSKGRFIQGMTQVFGFIWEDEELLEYIYMAIDDFNSRPPVTGIITSDLWGLMRRWRTAILLRAAAFACFAISMNWIADEFSIHKNELIKIKDENGEEYSLTAMELFDILYGDKIRKMNTETEEDLQKVIQEFKDADVQEII